MDLVEKLYHADEKNLLVPQLGRYFVYSNIFITHQHIYNYSVEASFKFHLETNFGNEKL